MFDHDRSDLAEMLICLRGPLEHEFSREGRRRLGIDGVFVQLIDTLVILGQSVDEDLDPTVSALRALSAELKVGSEIAAVNELRSYNFRPAGSESKLSFFSNGIFDGVSRSDHTSNLNFPEALAAFDVIFEHFASRFRRFQATKKALIDSIPSPVVASLMPDTPVIPVRMVPSDTSSTQHSLREDLIRALSRLSEFIETGNHINTPFGVQLQEAILSLRAGSCAAALGMALRRMEVLAPAFSLECPEHQGIINAELSSFAAYLSRQPGYVEDVLREGQLQEARARLQQIESEFRKAGPTYVAPQTIEQIKAHAINTVGASSTDLADAKATLFNLSIAISFAVAIYGVEMPDVAFKAFILVLEVIGAMTGRSLGVFTATAELLRTMGRS